MALEDYSNEELIDHLLGNIILLEEQDLALKMLNCKMLLKRVKNKYARWKEMKK